LVSVSAYVFIINIVNIDRIGNVGLDINQYIILQVPQYPIQYNRYISELVDIWNHGCNQPELISTSSSLTKVDSDSVISNNIWIQQIINTNLNGFDIVDHWVYSCFVILCDWSQRRIRTIWVCIWIFWRKFRLWYVYVCRI